MGGAERANVVITGASGQLGRRTAELVIEQRGADGLILVTRDPAALADLAAQGAEVRPGDFDQPDRLREALAGGQRMLLISAIDLERRTDQHRSAIQAAAGVGVRHVIYTSCLSPEPPNPAFVAPSHHATETALEESGLSWTILRNSLYAEYQVPEAARAVATGTLVHNRGDGRVAYVSREDCAAAAVAVLVGPGHEGSVYDITGPRALDAFDLASLYGEIGARTIEVVALDDESFLAGLIGGEPDDGHLRYGAELVTSFGRSVREGFMASCTDAVGKLTGRPAQALRDLLEAHRDQISAAPRARG
jgi:NAD(P)H dehydrogenase (quinone)